MKLDVFKQIKHTIIEAKKITTSQPPDGSFSHGNLTSPTLGKIGRFEPMQPVMIQQTHNYQARMESWLEDVGRFADFFLAK